MADDIHIAFEGITKVFAGVTALRDVTLSIRRGECHALMGENGAGKSTLAKVLAGIHQPDAGTVSLDGKIVTLRSPRAAAAAGIGVVHQELAFCPDLSIAENLMLGRYPTRAGVVVDRAAMRRKAADELAAIGADLDVTASMRTLSTGQEQLVQIAAAVAAGAKVLILDEPTSSLSEPEAQRLFELIGQLKQRGVTMIYVSHRLPEVVRLCDRVSVLRDGGYVGTLEKADITHDRMVSMMIGRTLEEYYPHHIGKTPGDVVARVDGLSSPGRFADVSLTVRAGEIVGLAGLVGSGRSEVAQAIFGLDSAARGSVSVGGKAVRLGRPRSAMAAGVGLVPEDRKRQGLILGMPLFGNTSLAVLERLSRFGKLMHRAERELARKYVDELSIRTPSIDSLPRTLSGGNQQKVVLSRWLARGGKLLIVDEPTRGVDVGAKATVHNLIDELAARGLAVLLISSELPEVLHLSTRILVMREGRLAGELPRDEASQEKLMRLMAGVEPAAA